MLAPIVYGSYCMLVFVVIVVHGTAPAKFLSSILYCTHIPEGRNANLSVSENFCGIALSSIFGKIFDNIIFEQYQHQLSCELRFDLQRKSSTNLSDGAKGNFVILLCLSSNSSFLHVSRRY
jgi:hypothetical protein